MRCLNPLQMQSECYEVDTRVPSQSYQLEFDAGTVEVRAALRDIRAFLKQECLSERDIGRIELVLAEVFNNIAKYAYPATEGGRVSFTSELSGDVLECLISDFGREMPNGELPAGTPPIVEVETKYLPEGGFGWSIIRQLTDDLRYSRIGRENVLRFAVHLNDGV